MIFYGCTSLTTIKCNESWAVEGDSVFYNCTGLVGGNGTEYHSSRISAASAAPDRTFFPGYFTATADLAVSGQLPTWTLQAAANWHRRRQTAYLYPYYRRQDLTTTELTATATRRLIYKKGVWTLTATAAFQQGSGEPYEDQTFATPSDKQTPPATMDDYLYQEYHWLTAPQYAVNASVQYAFRWPGTHVLPHIRVAAGHRKANTAPRTGYHRDRTTLDVGVGCTF